MLSKKQTLILVIIIIAVILLIIWIRRNKSCKIGNSHGISKREKVRNSGKCNGTCRGLPDVTFGTAGIIVDLPFLYTEGVKVLTQTDNKIIVIGNYIDVNGSGILIARYETNGLLDTTFGTAGYVLYSQNAASAHGGFLQEDGKIIVVGKSNAHAIVGRYLPNGDYDPDFNNGNYYEETSISNSIAYDVKVQTKNGYLIVVGAGYNTSYLETMMIAFRLTPNGLLDRSFGNGVILIQKGIGTHTRAYNVLLDRNEKIIVAGTAEGMFMFVAFKENGSLDLSFGSYGMSFQKHPQNADIDLFGAFLQKNGKIVVAGQIMKEGGSVALISRFHHNGILDKNFGTKIHSNQSSNGFLSDPWLNRNGSSAFGITGFCDDSFVVYGNSCDSDSGINYLVVAKYDTNGKSVTSFGGKSGIDTIPQSLILDAHWNSATVRPDGKLVLTGRTMNGSFQTEIIVGVYDCQRD